MTAADQPTTEPSAVERAWDDGARAALRSEGYEVTDHAAVLASNPHRLAPAPQPAADTETEVQWGVRALLDAASDAESIIANGDVAEIAAAPPGAVGRRTAVEARDAIHEDPAAWLRARAKTLMEEA